MANNPYFNKVRYGNQVLIDLTEDTVTANDMLATKTAHDKSGAPITGNIVNKGSTGITVSGSTTAAIPAGYYNGSGSVTVSDSDLVASNIKQGATILGVPGSYSGYDLPAYCIYTGCHFGSTYDPNINFNSVLSSTPDGESELIQWCRFNVTTWELDSSTNLTRAATGLGYFYGVDLTSVDPSYVDEYAFFWMDGTNTIPIWTQEPLPAYNVTTTGWQMNDFTPPIQFTADRSQLVNEFELYIDNVMAIFPVAFGDWYSEYDGVIAWVTPSVNAQELDPSPSKFFIGAYVYPIPYSETDNTGGGKTAKIGDNATPIHPPEGPGWLPASADYTWESAYLNIAQSSAWASLLSQLTYDANDQCVIARSYISDGVPMSQAERLVAFDFTSSNEGYGVAYVYDIDDGEGGTSIWIEPVYSTVAHYSSLTFYGEYWEEGVSVSSIQLDANYDHSSYDLGSLVPVINFPGSSSMLGWDAFWAGSEIAFGDYDSSSDRDVGKSIIQNTAVNLSLHDVFKWMADSGGRVHIRPYFFKDSTSLQSIVFPATIVSIGNSSFEGCTYLSSVTITKMPQSTMSHLQSIGSRAFYGCTSLTEIAIYFYSVYSSSIGDYAFAGCTNLHTLHFYHSSNIPTLGTDVFDTTSLQHIYVPSSYVANYQAAWPQYASYISAEPT